MGHFRSPILGMVASLALLVAGAWGLLDATRQSRWRPADAKPVFAVSASNRSFLDTLRAFDRGTTRRHRHYGIKVSYRYAFDGREFDGQYIHGKWTEEQAKGEAATFDLDRTFGVFVDPGNPARSVRERSSAGWSILLVLSGIAGLVGSYLLPGE